jgi:WD40 repeat protein
MNQNIQSLTKIMDIKHKANIFSIIELNDLRIATGDSIGYISLFSIDYEKEQWTKLREHQGHNKCITSLCELNENRLVSSSWDKTLKVWNINNNSIILLKKLKGHGNYVNQVISFTNNIIASGSYDKTIKVWDVNANGELRSLEENFKVCSLLKLNNKEIMASSGYGNSISFWNTQTYTKEHSVTCCDCNSFSGIIELPDTHYIAVSGGCSSSIDIIDTENYQLVKQIECKDYIINNGYCSSLHLLNNGTFVYSRNGSFCQISSAEPYHTVLWGL